MSSYELLSAPWVNKLQLQLQFTITRRSLGSTPVRSTRIYSSKGSV